MPASYVIDTERRRVISRAWGVLSEEELIAHYRAIAADLSFDPTFSQIADLREVTGFALSSSAVRREASMRVFDRTARRALVATSDIAFGLSRMYASEAYDVSPSTEVFRDMADAEEWLNQPGP
jgi:hypothetical protein